MRITKGFVYNEVRPQARAISLSISIYNTGFYIVIRNNGSVDTTTRNTPEKVGEYIKQFINVNHLQPDLVLSIGHHNVIKDSNGFYKTKI